jgi:hypothetical protein
VFTRRIFDGVVVTLLGFNLAVGLPRLWARRVVRAQGSPNWQKVVGSAVLHSTGQ